MNGIAALRYFALNGTDHRSHIEQNGSAPASRGSVIPEGAGPVTAFRVAFVLLAVILAIPATAALRLTRAAGASVTGRM